jgi:hypothetical protein
MSIDINSPEVAKELVKAIDKRIEMKFKELVKGLSIEKIGKMAAAGNGPVVQVYINNSPTAVEVKNPRGFSLVAGDLVAIVFPNFRNDSSKYIDRIL